MYPVLQLKPGREVPLRNLHPWIFTGAVEAFPDAEDGSIVEVRSAENHVLGFATVNRKTSIGARMISFKPGDPLEAVRKNILSAVELRRGLFDPSETTAFRIINSEGDNLPGFIVDKYADVLVLQVSTLGAERLKSFVLEVLVDLLKPSAIYEKSGGMARRKEGLEDFEGWIVGSVPEPLEVLESGLRFRVSFTGSQKTGLFLDQRTMRLLVRSLAKGRTVLDCFSYVGGFAVSALAGGAVAADFVDSDAKAIAQAKGNSALNGFSEDHFEGYTEDVFHFLERATLPRSYDCIILDPPAFAKRGSDVENALKGYTSLNRLALEHLPGGSLLLTGSCSYHIDRTLFQTAVFHAARQAHRSVRILHYHRLAFDHPINLYHPEGDYLKSLLLFVE